jgi:AcrR family transcriptional regulator
MASMARAALTTDQIDEFRERACACARRLFADRGFDGMSMRALAAELGCSPMTAYRYFENKADLFAHVRADAFRRFADAQKAAAGARDPVDRLRTLKQAYIDFAIADPVAYRIMFELHQEPTEPYPELEAEQRRAFDELHRAVAEAIQAGQMTGDPLTVAHLFWAQVHGVVALHLAGKLIMGRSFDELRAEDLTTRRQP